MATITHPPIQIDTSIQASGLFGTGVISEGPWQAPNGDLFVLLSWQAGTHIFSMFRSTDGGITWTVQDSMHAPPVWIGGFAVAQFDPTAGTNGVVTFAANETFTTPSHWIWNTFDCGTHLYGVSAIPTLTDVVANGLPTIPWVKRADGSIVAVYDQSPGVGTLGFRVYTGAWSGFNILQNTGGHSYTVQGIYLDPVTQTSHVIFGDSVGGVITWSHITIDSLNDVSAPDTIGAATTDDVFGTGLISGGVLYVPLTRGAPGFSNATMFSGTPLTAGIAWTTTVLQANARLNIQTAAVVVAGGVVTALWDIDGTSASNGINRSSLIGGVWSAPSVYYDLIANPPNAHANNFVSQIAPIFLTSGALNSVVTMIDPLGNFSAFSLAAAAGPVTRGVGQIAFFGVRRRLGFKSDPQVYTSPSYEKEYQIQTTVTLPIGWSKASGGLLTAVPVNDYEFEMRRIDGYGGLAGGYLGLDPGNFKILLLDTNAIQISNIPLLFSNLFHVPENLVNEAIQASANSTPKNFWPTPPMTYRVNTSIRFYLYMTSTTALVAPVNFDITFSGIRRYPCK
jgi:hypothetical protein